MTIPPFRILFLNPMLLGGEATPLKTALLPPEASW
jgi:hypothetical protein